MALFDKFRSVGSTNAAFTPQEATSGVLISVVASDGHISGEEAHFFNLVANRHPIFRDQPDAEFSRMIDKMFQILKRDGWESLVNKCCVDLPQEFKNTVFALAVDFVFADGSVEDEEKELVAQLQRSLGIPDDMASAIVDVLALKNGV